MNKITTVVSAFNAEKKIESCLKSVLFSNEIIVLDNSSTDKTGEIAKKYATVITQKNDPSAIDLLRNTGIRVAKNEWILIVDQDEEITPELKDEILEATKANVNIEGYWIPRKNYIFGKWIEHTGWWPDLQLRLFKNGAGEYEEKQVHQTVKIKGETGKLKNPIIHHNYETLREFLTKTILVYAPNEANAHMEKGYSFSFSDAIRFPLNEFISRFFAREGYKDGFHGLMLSILMAFYHFTVFAFLWEKSKFKEMDEKEMLAQFEKDKEKSVKELFHWISSIRIKNEKNLFKKLALKTKRKLKKII